MQKVFTYSTISVHSKHGVHSNSLMNRDKYISTILSKPTPNGFVFLARVVNHLHCQAKKGTLNTLMQGHR